jgi:hypothetical protein
MLPPIKGFENQPLVSLEKSIEPLISIVPDIEQMVWTVKQNCQKPEDGLSSDESGSIMLYTLEWEPPESSFYFILNSTLRTENRQKLRPWFLFFRLIIFALSKLPTIPHQIIYRGIKIDMSKQYEKENKFIWWAFSSCTSKIDVIKHFLGKKGPRTIINIESNSAKNISRHSFYQTENEILLYPARQFQVISSLDAGNQLHIVHLKEIEPPFPLIHIPQITSTVIITPIHHSYENQKLKDLIDKYQHHSEIKLSDQSLSDEDISIVVKEAIINKQCKTLWLSNNKITSAGTSIIAKTLNKNTTVEVLLLNYNQVGDTGVHFLTETLSLNNSCLRELYLTSTGITDNGAEYLAEMLKINTTLRGLFLAENNIGDQGIEFLANTLVNHNKTLEKMDLAANKLVTDSSLNSLAKMLTQNSSLFILYINNCNLSEEGKERLLEIKKIKKTYFSLDI